MTQINSPIADNAASVIVEVWKAVSVTSKTRFQAEVLQINGGLQDDDTIKNLILTNKGVITYANMLSLIDNSVEGW